MRLIPVIAILLLSACSRVGSNPWAHLDYAEANCGTKEAVLTTTGCITAPPANPAAASAAAAPVPISAPNAVGEDAAVPSNGHTSH